METEVTLKCVDCKKDFTSKFENDDVCDKCAKNYTFSDNTVRDLRYDMKED